MVFAIGVSVAPAARAAPRDDPVTPRIELRHDLMIDIPVTVGLAGSFITWALIRDEIVGKDCRWCDPPGEVNALDDAFRSALRRQDSAAASILSHSLAYGAAPLVLGGLNVAAALSDRRSNEVSVNLLLMMEATFGALAVSDAAKSLVLRERPFEHFIADEDFRRETFNKPESIVSFPSGHTSAVFAMTASSGMIASLRGYRIAPAIWIAGLMLGAATAYARMAADRHYFTDTLGGAAIGTLFGAGIPWLFHRPKAEATMGFLSRARVGAALVPAGRMVTVGWTF
jgi:membrane-associated phospholipid phosphatase